MEGVLLKGDLFGYERPEALPFPEDNDKQQHRHFCEVLDELNIG